MRSRCYVMYLDALLDGSAVRPGADAFIQFLRQYSLPFLILSQQSSRDRRRITEQLENAGIKGVMERDIYTTSMAAVDWCVLKMPERVRAGYIGGDALKSALRQGGYIMDSLEPELYFVGMDQHMNYRDYSDTLQCLLSGAKLVSVDSRKIMVRDGLQMLGNGAIVKMLEYASDQEALDFGRGSKHTIQMALRYLRVNEEDVMMIGTDFLSDIVPVLDTDMETVYVTWGESIEHTGMNNQCHPKYIVEDLYGMMK